MKFILTWMQRFWDNHGERLIFAALAITMATVFLIVGLQNDALKEFVGAGTTILIGVAMLFFNKTRSVEPPRKGRKEDPEPEPDVKPDPQIGGQADAEIPTN